MHQNDSLTNANIITKQPLLRMTFHSSALTCVCLYVWACILLYFCLISLHLHIWLKSICLRIYFSKFKCYIMCTSICQNTDSCFIHNFVQAISQHIFQMVEQSWQNIRTWECLYRVSLNPVWINKLYIQERKKREQSSIVQSLFPRSLNIMIL